MKLGNVTDKKEVWAVEVYRPDDLSTVEKVLYAVDTDDEIDTVMYEYIEKYKNNVGYTVEVTLLKPNYNNSGAYKIK